MYAQGVLFGRADNTFEAQALCPVVKADVFQFKGFVISCYGTFRSVPYIAVMSDTVLVNLCRNLRTLDAVALAFISGISNTPKESFRCYHTKQSNHTLWNC